MTLMKKAKSEYAGQGGAVEAWGTIRLLGRSPLGQGLT